MPLFRDLETFTIIYRQHEYNSEALDGKIVKVNSTEKAIVLEHVPNSSWSYDVKALFNSYVDTVFENYGNKITQKPSNPEKYLTIVLEKDLDNYINTNKFNFIKVIKVEKMELPKVSSTIALPKKSKFNDQPLPALDFSEDVKLLRDSEAPTYKYRPPNLR